MVIMSLKLTALLDFCNIEQVQKFKVITQNRYNEYKKRPYHGLIDGKELQTVYDRDYLTAEALELHITGIDVIDSCIMFITDIPSISGIIKPEFWTK